MIRVEYLDEAVKRRLHTDQYLDGGCEFNLEHITQVELFMHKTALEVDL